MSFNNRKNKNYLNYLRAKKIKSQRENKEPKLRDYVLNKQRISTVRTIYDSGWFYPEESQIYKGLESANYGAPLLYRLIVSPYYFDEGVKLNKSFEIGHIRNANHIHFKILLKPDEPTTKLATIIDSEAYNYNHKVYASWTEIYFNDDKVYDGETSFLYPGVSYYEGEVVTRGYLKYYTELTTQEKIDRGLDEEDSYYWGYLNSEKTLPLHVNREFGDYHYLIPAIEPDNPDYDDEDLIKIKTNLDSYPKKLLFSLNNTITGGSSGGDENTLIYQYAGETRVKFDFDYVYRPVAKAIVEDTDTFYTQDDIWELKDTNDDPNVEHFTYYHIQEDRGTKDVTVYKPTSTNIKIKYLVYYEKKVNYNGLQKYKT